VCMERGSPERESVPNEDNRQTVLGRMAGKSRRSPLCDLQEIFYESRLSPAERHHLVTRENIYKQAREMNE